MCVSVQGAREQDRANGFLFKIKIKGNIIY